MKKILVIVCLCALPLFADKPLNQPGADPAPRCSESWMKDQCDGSDTLAIPLDSSEEEERLEEEALRKKAQQQQPKPPQ